MSLEQRKSKWLKEFENLETWEEKFKKIIEIGKTLPPFPEEYRIEDNRVSGCVSKVWIFAKKNEGKLKLFVDSEAMIVKGLVGLLYYIYSDSEIVDILQDNGSIIKKIGLDEHLSPSRVNGLYSAFKQIRIYALAFLTQESK